VVTALAILGGGVVVGVIGTLAVIDVALVMRLF